MDYKNVSLADFVKAFANMRDNYDLSDEIKDTCAHCGKCKEDESFYDGYSAWEVMRVDDAACDINTITLSGETLNQNFINGLKIGEDGLYFIINDDDENPIIIPFNSIPSIVEYLQAAYDLYDEFYEDPTEEDEPIKVSRKDIEKLLGSAFELTD